MDSDRSAQKTWGEIFWQMALCRYWLTALCRGWQSRFGLQLCTASAHEGLVCTICSSSDTYVHCKNAGYDSHCIGWNAIPAAAHMQRCSNTERLCITCTVMEPFARRQCASHVQKQREDSVTVCMAQYSVACRTSRETAHACTERERRTLANRETAHACTERERRTLANRPEPP